MLGVVALATLALSVASEGPEEKRTVSWHFVGSWDWISNESWTHEIEGPRRGELEYATDCDIERTGDDNSKRIYAIVRGGKILTAENAKRLVGPSTRMIYVVQYDREVETDKDWAPPISELELLLMDGEQILERINELAGEETLLRAGLSREDFREVHPADLIVVGDDAEVLYVNFDL